ncbi:MAG: hypothetical protein ABI255_10420, partial [Microbacteriaceae bacterium]
MPDPEGVVAAKDTQSSKPMSTTLSAQYDAAVAAVFDDVRVSAPAVIVGVRSPKGTWTKAYGVA